MRGTSPRAVPPSHPRVPVIDSSAAVGSSANISAFRPARATRSYILSNFRIRAQVSELPDEHTCTFDGIKGERGREEK